MKTLAVVILMAGSALAQNPILEGMLREHSAMQEKILTAAEKAPEEIYSFRPTREVFPLRKMFLHLAGGQNSLCARFTTTPAPKVEEEKDAGKAETIATLKQSFEYCRQAFSGASDATLAEMVESRGRRTPKSYYLAHLIGHNELHYGNIVTYMRLKGLSPGN